MIYPQINSYKINNDYPLHILLAVVFFDVSPTPVVIACRPVVVSLSEKNIMHSRHPGLHIAIDS